MDIKTLHKDALIFDAHVDTAIYMLDNKADLKVNSKKLQVDIPKLLKGEVDSLIFAAFVNPKYGDKSYARANALIKEIKKQVQDNSDQMEIVLAGKKLEKVCNSGKIAVMLSVEGGHAIKNDISNLDRFYCLGVRAMTLTWMNTNYFADASGDDPKWNGLNQLGVNVIKRMNNLGMLIDVSHASDKTFYDVIENTGKPIVASHSGVRKLYDFHRNMTDDMLKALAENGGVIGIPFSPSFLDKEFATKSKELEKKMLEGKDLEEMDKPEFRALLNKEAEKELKPIGVSKLIDHIDHAVEIAGINHVGLGSDFDGITFYLNGLENCSKMINITKELAVRGYTERDIKKILGGNFVRVIKAVVA